MQQSSSVVEGAADQKMMLGGRLPLVRHWAGFCDAASEGGPLAVTVGVAEAPRHEIAGGEAARAQRLWGFGCRRASRHWPDRSPAVQRYPKYRAVVCYLVHESTGAGRKRSPGGCSMSGVRRREFISKGALAVTELRQLIIGCAPCGSALASRGLPLVCPSSNHNGRQKNCGSEGRKSWDTRIGGRFARS
jgi:hypothetical protein